MRYIPLCAAGSLSVRKCAKLTGLAPFSVSRLKKRYKQYARVVLTWSPDVTAENTTADGSRVLLSVSLGSAGSKIDSAPIVEYLRGVIAEKSRADFAPYNEDNLKKELLENIK